MEDVFATMIEEFQRMAPHLWAVMVRQAQVEGWYNLIWFFVLIGFWIAGAFLFRLWLRKWRESGEELIMWDWGWVCAPFIFASIGLLIATPMCLYTAVMNLCNPEFAAIRWLISAVTN